MAQYSQTPITAADIERFLADRDDFAFEMQVLRLFQSASIKGTGFGFSHGGHYTDSVTGKSRQYDIRATISIELNHLRISAECKQLTQANPLVISRVPRSNPDCHHYLIVSKARDVISQYEDRPHFHVARSAYGSSLYTGGQHVGKSCFQLGRTKHPPHDFLSGDSEVYEKWAQALASAEDLVWNSIHDHDRYGRDEKSNASRSVVLPMLVIPNETLWVQDYSDIGVQIGKPRQVDHCEFALSKTIQKDSPWLRFIFTHMHVFTIDGLTEFFSGENGLRSLWPNQLFPGFDGGSCLQVMWDDEPKPRR